MDAGRGDGGDLWMLFAGGLSVLSETGSYNNLPGFLVVYGESSTKYSLMSKAVTSFWYRPHLSHLL